MQEETITILKINAVDAVNTIAGLQENIKKLKGYLQELEVGGEDYAAVLTELQNNQAALRNAMHATTKASDDEVDSFAANARASKGLSDSYNGLVRQMAILDQEFRATEDAARRTELGNQIRDINDQLKKLDAERGKFGRNVGNYTSALSGLGDILKDMPPTLGKTATEAKKVGTAIGLIGKQPILGMVGLLAPIIVKIAEGLKDNETALGAVKKMGDALQPVAEFFAGILEKIAGWISRAVDYVIDLGEKSGLNFKKIVSGAVGVGNTIVQFILSPIRQTIAALRGLGKVFNDIFTGKFKEAAEDAKQAITEIGDAFKNGIDFKGNFEAGKAAGEAFISGLESPGNKKKAGDAGATITKAALKSAEEILKGVDNRIDLSLKARVDAEKKAAQEEAELMAIFAGQMQDATDTIQAELDAQTAAFLGLIVAEREAAEEEERIRKQRLDNFVTYTAAIGNLATSLADIYEADADASEEAAAKAKALKVAGAIISTIGGAVSAYTSTIESVPAPANMILAPINAAAVLAAGYAQVKQMQSVSVGKKSMAGATVAAPTYTPNITQVRSVTGASEEERLNRMAADQRVYILASDLQAERRATRVQIQETSF